LPAPRKTKHRIKDGGEKHKASKQNGQRKAIAGQSHRWDLLRAATSFVARRGGPHPPGELNASEICKHGEILTSPPKKLP
jgi:hypothetical protein